MVLRKLAVALLSAGVMLPGLGHALAVKDVQTKSALGEPYSAEVELTELGDLNADEIRVSLATQEDFDRLGIERVYFLSELQFEVVVNAGGRSYIKVTTSKPVREPYLDYVVRIAWPGNTRLQEITALLDPPVVTEAAAPAVEQAVSSAGSEAPPAIEPLEEVVAEPAPATDAPAPVVSTPAKKEQPAASVQPEPAEDAAAPSPAPQADSYRTRSGDTMARIAQQFRPDGASTNQTMVAIQQANPKAFAEGNINQLKRGQVLRIPSESDIRAISASEASASIRQQTQTWRNNQAAAAPALEGQQLDATAAAPAAPAAAAPVSKPEMKLLGAEAGKAGSAAAGKEQGVAAKPEDSKKLDANKARAEAAKAEKAKLAGNVSSLDAQVKANDKQLEVQNAKLAELQAKLKEQQDKQAAKAAAAPAAAATPVAPATPAAPDAAAAATPLDAAAPADMPAAAADAAAPAAAPQPAPAIEAQPLPAPKPAVVVDEAPAEEGLPLPLIGGAAGLLAVLGGLFFWNRKRKQAQAEEAAALAELEAMDDVDSGSGDALFLDGVDAAVAADADADWPAPEAAAVQDRVLADPLEEVEQYLAYERYPQAAGLLNKAIAAHPERADLRLKLLEVYARLDDHSGFSQQQAWFEQAGDLQGLARAEELRAQLSVPKRAPSRDDPLHFERSAVAAPAASDELPSLEDLEMDFNASVSASSPAVPTLKDEALTALDQDFAFAEPAAASKAADSHLSLDEDLDFSYTEPSLKVESKPVQPQHDELELSLDDLALDSTSTAAGGGSSLDFSLEDELAAVAEPAAATGKMSLGELADFDTAPELKEPELKTSDDDLSFSLDDLEVESASLDDKALQLDGDFSLDEAKPSSLSFDDTVQTDSGLNDMAADFDSTLQADTAASSAAVTPAAPVKAAATDLAVDDEFDFLADTDENATKLDLARAYIDMGDKEGARDILQEVLSEGNSSQKEEAKGLLAQVS